MLYDVIEGRGVLGSGVETSGLGGSRLLVRLLYRGAVELCRGWVFEGFGHDTRAVQMRKPFYGLRSDFLRTLY